MARCIWCGNWPPTHLHVVVGGRDFYGCPPKDQAKLRALMEEHKIPLEDLEAIAREGAEMERNRKECVAEFVDNPIPSTEASSATMD